MNQLQPQMIVLKEATRLIPVPEDLFHMLADDMGGALKPFDVRLLMMLLPDLLVSPEPVRINLSYYASLMGKTLPQLSRSMTNLVKSGYLVRCARSKVSYTYSLNAGFLSTIFGGGDALRQLMTSRGHTLLGGSVYGKSVKPKPNPDVVTLPSADLIPME